MNDSLLRQVAGHIRLFPETHDQSEWCGTSMCVAGWTLALSGYEVVSHPLFKPEAGVKVFLHRESGDIVHVPEIPSVAADLLGLDDNTADVIFYSMDFDPEVAASYAEALELIADGFVDAEEVLV